MVGRIGGDEFVIFVRNVIHRKDVYEKTNSLVNIISSKENLSIPDNVTISIGLVFSDGTENDYSSLFAKADEALYSSKHSGKSCYSEYGAASTDTPLPLRTILVMSGSRNVLSMLEFACDANTDTRQVGSIEEINTIITGSAKAAPEQSISCIYIDISDIPDNGQKLLDEIHNTISNIPIIIICREGCMEQIRIAASHDFTSDILFSPLETATLKRRVTEHLKEHK